MHVDDHLHQLDHAHDPDGEGHRRPLADLPPATVKRLRAQYGDRRPADTRPPR